MHRKVADYLVAQTLKIAENEISLSNEFWF